MSGLAWDDGDVPLLRWASAPAGAGVAFTSRRGGVSDGPFRSLNLGALTADAAANVAENRRRAVAAAGGDGVAATMAWQVHGADVREVDERPAPGRFLEPGAEAFPKSDGLVTGLAGRPLVLLTADCIPVAIAREDGRRLVCYDCGVACDMTMMREERVTFLDKLGAERRSLPVVKERSVEVEVEERRGRRGGGRVV